MVRRALSLAALLAVIPAAYAQYVEVDLTSNGFLKTPNFDDNLVNPWGIAFSPTGPFWVADNGTGLSTVYDTNGAPFPTLSPLVVPIPPKGSSPTGVVFNSSG